MRPALLAMLVVACGRGVPNEERAAEEKRLDSLSLRTELRTGRPQPPLPPRPPCAATGNWAECSILERLTRAGLGPRPDPAGATEEPLAPRGMLVRVGRSELELYFYSDPAARERDEAKLDKTKYTEYAKALTMNPLPTLISNANLIAVLHSRNDHQRERVGDAITAGPPQPAQ